MKCDKSEAESKCDCAPYEKAKETGVTIEELVSYAKCNGIRAEGYFASDEKESASRKNSSLEMKGIDHFREVLCRTQLEREGE